MEGNKNRVGRKPEKEKPHLNLFVGGGAGIGGVVLWGGGLAVAAMVAAFTVIKNQRTRRRDDQNQEAATATDDSEKGDAIRGLSFFLQTPATTVNQNSCCTNHETAAIGVTVNQIDSCDLVSTHNLLLEDKPVNPGTGNQEILLSDDSSEDNTSSYDIITTEKFSLQVPDGVPLDGLENMIENDSVESFQFVETIEVKKDDEAVDAEVLAREENLPLLLVGEEEEDDVYGENVIEKERENSEGNFAVGENSAKQAILFSDETDQASIASGIDMLCTEDSSMAAPDGRSLDEPENMINNGSGENLQFTETIEVIEEEEAANTDKMVVEENSHMQWIEDHKEDDSCEGPMIEKEEGNSEGKLAVDENLQMQVVEKEAEETEIEISEQHAAEIVEVSSQGKLAAEDNSLTQLIQEEEDDDDSGDDSSEEVTEEDEEEESSEGTGSSSMESNVEANWSAVEEGSLEKLAVEDNSLTLPIEEEDDDDNSSEEVKEEEERTEGTGNSSIESNVETIWPAEMIESQPLELNETNVNCQNSMDKIIDEDRMAKASNQDLVDCKSDGKIVSKERVSNNETTENSRMMLNKKAVQEHAMAHSPNWRIWIWLMLVLLLLLLLLHIHGTSITHDSVIVP